MSFRRRRRRGGGDGGRRGKKGVIAERIERVQWHLMEKERGVIAEREFWRLI